MNCCGKLRSCGPPVARWKAQTGYWFSLCQTCLDHWLDNADDDDTLEPAAWEWLPKPGVWRFHTMVMLPDPPHVAEAIRDIRRNGGPITRTIYRGSGA